jgi:hypothetical protein
MDNVTSPKRKSENQKKLEEEIREKMAKKKEQLDELNKRKNEIIEQNKNRSES